MTQFSVPVIEYASANPGAAVIPAKPNFQFNDRQLVIAMVRSILTANPGKKSRKYLAAIVKPTLNFLLDWTNVPDLRLSDDFSILLRDFSLTTRIGELAQGVSTAFWKWERGYLLITDFGPWVAGLQPPYTGTKSPDFVIYNPMTNDLAVMEAKGTSSGDHRVAMGKSLRQCRDAAAHPAFNRSFGSVLTLSTKIAGGKGALHVRDPAKDTAVSKNLAYYIFRRSYASWFELVGDDELAAWCRQEFDGTTGITETASRISQADRNTNSQLKYMVAGALGFQPNLAEFDIAPEIINALAEPEAFPQVEWAILARTELAFGRRNSNQQGIFFPDGTMITQR